MKAKLYKTQFGNWTTFSGENGERTPTNAYLIHSKKEREYSLKKIKGKKYEHVKDIYFVGEFTPKVKAEFERGQRFFSRREGFLFGAYHELTKMGEIVILERCNSEEYQIKG